MVSLGLWLGRTAEEKVALATLQRHEDEKFELQPNEENDLATHVRAETPRFRLLRDRMTLGAAQNDRKQDRNWYTVLILGAIMVVKGMVPPAIVAAIFHYLFGM